MKSLQLLTLALSLAAFHTALPSCAEKPDEKPKKKGVDQSKPHIVGRIASVVAEQKFVLIQSYGTWNIATGSVLTTQGTDGRAANLRVTGEKSGQYAAADIKSGILEVGDGVYTIATPPKLSSDPETDPAKVEQEAEVEKVPEDETEQAEPAEN